MKTNLMEKLIYSFERYTAFAIVICLIRQYGEDSLSSVGYTIFKTWLVVVGAAFFLSYLYAFAKKIKRTQLGIKANLTALVVAIVTCLVFEYY